MDKLTLIIKPIALFVSKHFELICYINLAIIIFFLIVFIAVQLSLIPYRRVFKSIPNFLLFIILMLLQGVMLGITYWDFNIKPVRVVEPHSQIYSHTEWVLSDLQIYYIDNNVLRTIKVNGQDEDVVFTADEPIREYHFSGDGKMLLIATTQELYLKTLGELEPKFIDGITREDLAKGIKGVVSSIRWSPDSKKFCYEVSKWSSIGNKDNTYVYNIETDERNAVHSPYRRISTLRWDKASTSLYYLQYEALDTEYSGHPYNIKIIKISLSDFKAQLIDQIPYDKSTVPIESLDLRGIELDLSIDKLSFNMDFGLSHLRSKEGPRIGLDDQDVLYYIQDGWFKKKLFRIPRYFSKSDRSNKHSNGELVFSQMQWLPGGKYVIMESIYGILILEPASEKLGKLKEGKLKRIGWYSEI